MWLKGTSFKLQDVISLLWLGTEDRVCGVGEMREGDQRVQTSGQMSESCRSIKYSTVTVHHVGHLELAQLM